MKHGMRMKTGLQMKTGIQMERGIRREHGIRMKRGGIWRRWIAGVLAAVMLAELVPVYARDAADGQAAESSHSTVYDGGQSAADGSKSTAQDGRKNTAQTSGQAGDQAVTLARREDALTRVGGAAVQTKHRAAADAAGGDPPALRLQGRGTGGFVLPGRPDKADRGAVFGAYCRAGWIKGLQF